MWYIQLPYGTGSEAFTYSQYELRSCLYQCWEDRTDLKHLEINTVTISMGVEGYAVVRLLEELRYKPEGCGFDSRWCHWWPWVRISLYDWVAGIFPEGEGKGGRCVGPTLPHACTDCLDIWEPQPPGSLKACPGIDLPSALTTIRVEMNIWRS